MPENSHRQKHNGFSFAFRLTRRTSDHRKETEKDEFPSKKRALMQEMRRILRFDWHPRHFARMKKLSSFGDIIKWRKKNRNLETNLDFVILQGRRNFAHFPTNFYKEWKKKHEDESWFSKPALTSSSIKHHVGYILPNVADYIDIRIPALVA